MTSIADVLHFSVDVKNTYGHNALLSRMAYRADMLERVAEMARIVARHDPAFCPGCDRDGRDLGEGPHQPDCANQNLRLALKALDEVRL